MAKLNMPEELRAYFRECSARRQRVNRNCAYCGAELRDVTTRRRYCGNSCVQRALRERKRAGADTPPTG